MLHIQFENVNCSYIDLIDSKYSLSSLKAFVHRVATIHKTFLYLLMELNSRPLFLEATIVQSMMLHPLPKWTNSIKMSFDHEQFCFKVNS